GDKASNESVLVLIALDEGQNVILSFGKLDPSTTWTTAKDVLSPRVLSGGISYCQDYYSRCADTKVTREINNWPAIENINGVPGASGSGFAVQWDLDPLTLSHAVDRQNAAVSPTARLPAVLKVALLFNIHDLPFKSSNLALPAAYSLWGDPGPS